MKRMTVRRTGKTLMSCNPYKRLQRPAVAQPGEREYQLGMAVMEFFLRECAEKDITNQLIDVGCDSQNRVHCYFLQFMVFCKY